MTVLILISASLSDCHYDPDAAAISLAQKRRQNLYYQIGNATTTPVGPEDHLMSDPIFSEFMNSSLNVIDVNGLSPKPTFFTTVADYQRGKRGALELGFMMKCASGCDPLAYKGYGCYCGFLGSGTAVDGIDK